MTKIFAGMGGLLIVLALGGQALARERAAAESALLDTVVVTAGRTEERVKELSVPVTVITEKDIQRTNAQTLPDLLKQYGVLVAPAGAGTGSAKVTVRGFPSTANPLENGTVLILLDGRRIGNNNIGHLPLQNIGRVEIIRGAASVQYGSEATGGVINLISRRGGEKLQAFLEQSLGSWERTRTQAGISGQAGPVDFSLGGSYYQSGDVDVGGESGRYHNTGIDGRWLGGLNVGYNFNENHRLGLTASLSEGDYARSGTYDPARGNAQYPFGKSKRVNNSWELKYEGGLADSDLTWMARYFQGETSYETATNWNTRGGYYKYTGDFKGASLAGSWNNGLLYLTGGLDYYGIDYVKTTTPPPTAYSHDLAGFLLAKLALLDDTLWLNGGLRHDRYEIESGAVNPRDVARQEKSRTTPSLGLAWLPQDWLKLRANLSSSFKMPEPISQMSYSPGSTIYLANPDLKPESSRGWDISADVYYEALTLGLTYFSVNYKDKIESELLSPGVRQYRNLPGRTEYRGLEASAEWRMGETFGWDFELKPYLSLTKMFRYFNVGLQKKTGSVADLSASYGLVFDHEALGFQASLDATYYGTQYPHYTTAQVPFGGETVIDLHLAKRLLDWPDGGRLILKADLLNLNNRYYETMRNYPEEGRSFMLGLRYEY